VAQGRVKRGPTFNKPTSSIYDRVGQVWILPVEDDCWLVLESTTSNDRRKLLHRCFNLENGGFSDMVEHKVKRWEWMSHMTRLT